MMLLKLLWDVLQRYYFANNVYMLLRLHTTCLMLMIGWWDCIQLVCVVCKMIDVVYMLLRLLDVIDVVYKELYLLILYTSCLQNDWCCLHVDEIVRCDLSVLQIAKKLLRWLLTIDNIYFADMVSVVKWCWWDCLNVVNTALESF